MKLRQLAAEFIGTAMLLTAVVGSGIMAERLAAGNAALALLANIVATGAALAAIILTFAPVSGAHLNPVVSIAAAFGGEFTWRSSALYVAVQLPGAVFGTAVANVMFDMPILFASAKVRTGFGQWLGEFVATFGLVGVIVAVSRRQHIPTVAAAVTCYVIGACWFTSSTSLANPAVTIARSLTDTFTGIRPADVPAFIIAQLAGGIAAAVLFDWLVPKEKRNDR